MWIRKSANKRAYKLEWSVRDAQACGHSAQQIREMKRRQKKQQQQHWCGVIVCGVKLSYLKILLAFIAFYVRFSQCAPFVEPEREKHTKIANDFPFAFTRRTPFFFSFSSLLLFFFVVSLNTKRPFEIELEERQRKSIQKIPKIKYIDYIGKRRSKTLLRAHHVYCGNEFKIAIVAHSSGTCIKVELFCYFVGNVILFITSVFISPKSAAVIVNVNVSIHADI